MAPIEVGVLGNATAAFNGLTSSGPVALFDADHATLVVGPLDNFKSAVHHARGPLKGTAAWETGVGSEVRALPPGFVHRTLVLLGSGAGVTAGVGEWGRLARLAKGTDRSLAAVDLATNYLSYWTDNGAYYYGDRWGEAGGGGAPCNQSSLEAVASGLAQDKLLGAVRVWQLDDWWYPGNQSVCVRPYH